MLFVLCFHPGGRVVPLKSDMPAADFPIFVERDRGVARRNRRDAGPSRKHGYARAIAPWNTMMQSEIPKAGTPPSGSVTLAPAMTVMDLP